MSAPFTLLKMPFQPHVLISFISTEVMFVLFILAMGIIGFLLKSLSDKIDDTNQRTMNQFAKQIAVERQKFAAMETVVLDVRANLIDHKIAIAKKEINQYQRKVSITAIEQLIACRIQKEHKEKTKHKQHFAQLQLNKSLKRCRVEGDYLIMQPTDCQEKIITPIFLAVHKQFNTQLQEKRKVQGKRSLSDFQLKTDLNDLVRPKHKLDNNRRTKR